VTGELQGDVPYPLYTCTCTKRERDGEIGGETKAERPQWSPVWDGRRTLYDDGQTAAHT